MPRYAFSVLQVGVVSVTAGPEDEKAASAVSRGHLRASHADRERVIGTLKAAFIQGRLAKDELDLRVGQAFASRTYGELAGQPSSAGRPGLLAVTATSAASASAVGYYSSSTGQPRTLIMRWNGTSWSLS
jgi:hypothetical protein